MIIIYGSFYYGDYSWRLKIAMLRAGALRKDKKYSLINPFLFEPRVDIFDCEWEIRFGSRPSSQIRSSRREAYF